MLANLLACLLMNTPAPWSKSTLYFQGALKKAAKRSPAWLANRKAPPASKVP